MTVWTLHPLNTRHALTPVLAEVRQASRAAIAQARGHLDLPDFDLIVRAGADRSADGAVQGQAPAPGVIDIAVTPGRFDAATFARVLVRQLVHLVRHDGPGYGRALGEVLVSEGVAGHIAQAVLGGGPVACDSLRPAPGAARQAMNEWARGDYDHGRWFLGRGDLRRWTGHSLGHRIIAEHLAQAPGETAAGLVRAPADAFRQTLRRIIAADDPAAPDTAASSEG